MGTALSAAVTTITSKKLKFEKKKLFAIA